MPAKKKTPSRKTRKTQPKTFVLDTNVLLHSSLCITSFEDNRIVLPMTVIEELDKFKSHNDELGRNARHVIRSIDTLRAKGSLKTGVKLDNGGKLRILLDRHIGARTLSEEIPDNRILRLAVMLQDRGERVIFVSKDINARVKADALGIEAQDFEREKVNVDELYTGYVETKVDSELIESFHRTDGMEDESVDGYPNQFVMLRAEATRRHALCRMMHKHQFTHLNSERSHAWNVKSRNREQRMAMELLLDRDVQIVTLVGQAGTGKTLLALATGLQSTLRNRSFDRILVSRPIIPLGKDIGYLPGAKEEKLSAWMQPIFDNLNFLLREPIKGKDSAIKKGRKATAQDRLHTLIDTNMLELEALTYIRGRSISNQYMIVDEAQNLTPHEVKTIVSRAGEGTKIVLTGDPYQIDNPYLDASSNGLTYATERLKDTAIHGHMTLRKSERSPLAAIAAERL